MASSSQQFGYHIIKVTDHKPAETRSLEQVRTQIEEQIKWERAQKEAQRIADQVAAQLKKPADFDTAGEVARPHGGRIRVFRARGTDRRPGHGAGGR